MKKCPYCAEEIQDEAIKCKYCKSFLKKPEVIQKDEPKEVIYKEAEKVNYELNYWHLFIIFLVVVALVILIVPYFHGNTKQVKAMIAKADFKEGIASALKNQAYETYNEKVRNSIKERVYVNYDKMEVGHVYVVFIIASDGTLKETKIIPEKTDASEHLQEIAIRSIREAGPFPSFLKGMNLSEYPFNIEIQYQVD